jgi:Secretion system C-terminal sorting domain
MKNNFIKSILTIITIALIVTTFQSNSGGYAGGGIAGCSCHGNANGAAIVTLTGMPSTGYTNGTAYICTLNVHNIVMLKAGFALQVSGGIISNIPANVTLVNNTEITHSNPKTMVSGDANWIFTWTAPLTGNATIDVNYAANSVNGNNQTSGDQWNIATMQIPIAGVVINAPTVTTNAANNITFNSATLNGICNANNGNTTLQFKYGTTTAYGQTVNANPNMVTGNVNTNCNAAITGLLPNTVYHYKLVGQNSSGITDGADNTFTTLTTSIITIEKPKLKIYPNPCTNSFEIANAENINQNNIIIIDATGKQINVPITKKDLKIIRFNTEHLYSGIYFLILKKDNLSVVEKFFKQ